MNPVDFDRVVLSDVSRYYGRRRALSQVSVSFGAGEIIGLVGPNGAGKSTLIALVAGLLSPSAGEIRYGDTPGAGAGAALRGAIGLLAHELHLYPELTAGENLTFFATLYGVPDVPRVVSGALARAGLTERAGDAVAGFSRGMRQRLALERALLHAPRLVLLDEPFTGLDDASAAALVARLLELRAEGRIVALATHDLETADAMLDRALLVRDGRVRALDEGPAPLRERYRAAIDAAARSRWPQEPGA